MTGKPILVLGGGIAGMTAALEAAEAGCDSILVEKSPWLGGRVARLHLYFPKLCPPGCGLEINFSRIKRNRRITVLTLAELESLSGTPGDYEATIKISPRYVTSDCTLCGACASACPIEIPDEFNLGMSKTKTAYLPHGMAFPASYAIARSACRENCRACADACPYGAIDLGQQAERKVHRVSAVVAATGWAPYDASKLDNLGFGKYQNVITNVMMERLAAPDGPTSGRILRPSDGKEPKSVVFVQCAGSRDENHLPYCSSVCCAASLKQATYVRTVCPDAVVTIFYIDIRTGGRLEDFHVKVAADERINLVKGKVARIEPCKEPDNLAVVAEDILSGKKTTVGAGLVVLATGIVPQTSGLPAGFVVDEYRFLADIPTRKGLYSAGCVRRPEEVSAAVQDATGAALKAFQSAVRSAAHG